MGRDEKEDSLEWAFPRALTKNRVSTLLVSRTIETINCSLSHQICGTLLQQAQQTSSKLIHTLTHTHKQVHTSVCTPSHTYPPSSCKTRVEFRKPLWQGHKDSSKAGLLHSEAEGKVKPARQMQAAEHRPSSPTFAGSGVPPQEWAERNPAAHTLLSSLSAQALRLAWFFWVYENKFVLPV